MANVIFYLKADVFEDGYKLMPHMGLNILIKTKVRRTVLDFRIVYDSDLGFNYHGLIEMINKRLMDMGYYPQSMLQVLKYIEGFVTLDKENEMEPVYGMYSGDVPDNLDDIYDNDAFISIFYINTDIPKSFLYGNNIDDDKMRMYSVKRAKRKDV